ncbi:MAG: glutathione peroxidase [Bdellovibrionales bacterium]|nr:glutathione peroxidase [Bdellovibrionales bacterium]
MKNSIYEFDVKDASGNKFSFADHRGEVILVVNVASQCGFTPQYDELEAVYEKYKGQGFTIVGFPCNQFGGQEPGTDSEIIEFCRKNHGVTFPIMSKVEVNGANAEPVYQFLKEKAPGLLGSEMIKWNFTKFLVGKDGKVIDRYAPATSPKKIEKDIEEALKA